MALELFVDGHHIFSDSEEMLDGLCKLCALQMKGAGKSIFAELCIELNVVGHCFGGFCCCFVLIEHSVPSKH